MALIFVPVQEVLFVFFFFNLFSHDDVFEFGDLFLHIFLLLIHPYLQHF